VAPHLGCHVSVAWVNIGLGAKTSTCAKLRTRFCSFFLKGLKQLLSLYHTSMD